MNPSFWLFALLSQEGAATPSFSATASQTRGLFPASLGEPVPFNEGAALARVEKALDALCSKQPFLSGFVRSWREPGGVTIVPASEPVVCATDGLRLKINHRVAMETSTGMLEWMVNHEAAHLFLGHHLRRGDREQALWNIACDCALHDYLKSEMPNLNWGGTWTALDRFLDSKKVLSSQQPVPLPAGASAETIYDALAQYHEEKGSESLMEEALRHNAERFTGNVCDFDSLSEEEEDPLEIADEQGFQESETSPEDLPRAETLPEEKESKPQQSEVKEAAPPDCAAPPDSMTDEPEFLLENEESDALEGGEGEIAIVENAEDGAEREEQTDGDGEGEGVTLISGVPPQTQGDENHPLDFSPSLRGQLAWQAALEEGLRAQQENAQAQQRRYGSTSPKEENEPGGRDELMGIVGTLPSWARRLAGEAIWGECALDWRTLLRRFFDEKTRKRTTYMRPSRRRNHLSKETGLIIPGRQSRQAGRGRVILDTSGSMNKRSFEIALGEIESILSAFPDAEVELLMCDTVVKESHRLLLKKSDFPLRVPPEWLGGGGTNLSPALVDTRDNARQLSWCAVLTDMDWQVSSAPDPGIPTLWLSTDVAEWDLTPNKRPTFGQVLGPILTS
jgi:predicted metal-dependent peptidase